MKMPWRQLGEPWCSLPLVSLAVAVVWLLLGLGIEVGFSSSLRDADHRLYTAARFALQHPEVQVTPRILPVAKVLLPSFESNEAFEFLRRKGARPGGTQEQFAALSEAGLAAADGHPYRILGLVPAAPAAAAFASHALVHSGLGHLFAGLLLFLLVAPELERLWGRRVFAGALLTWGLAGGALYVLVHSGSDRALPGASVLVAGCVAALLARAPREEFDFLAWARPVANVQLTAPAWALAPLWLAAAGIAAWSIPGKFPGLDNAIGWTAQAGGALLGAATAIGIERFGWEERFGTPLARQHVARSRENFDLAKVKAQFAAGQREVALAALQNRIERSPGHRDAVLQWFVWAVEEEDPERAAPAVVALMRHELRRGADELALAQWAELADHVPDLEVDADTLLRLAKVAARVGQDESLQLLLQGAVDAAPAADALAQAAVLAAEVAPELALFAARTALSDSELSAGRRTELEALTARFAAGEPGAAPVDGEEKPRKGAERPGSVFYEESDRSAFGAVDDLGGLGSFPQGVLSEGVPIELIDGALRTDVAERGTLDVGLDRVRAVAMAGVHGLGPRPVVLVDLLLDGSGSERPLSVLRLRSDRFDPRTLLDAQLEPLPALCAFVAQLLAASGGAALPDADSAAGRPVKVYASLDEYHEQALQPAALQLG